MRGSLLAPLVQLHRKLTVKLMKVKLMQVKPLNIKTGLPSP
jgi:hypothetical protein